MFKLVPVFAIAAIAAFGNPTINDAAVDTGSAPAGASSAQDFVIDGLHSSVLFRVQHLKAAPFYGRFNAIEGRFCVDPEDLDESFFEVTIPVDSVDTANEKRDDHLKSGDFFAAKEFPKITLKSTAVEKAGADRYTVTADLTLRGETHPVTVDVVHTGTAEISERFGLRCGYEATFTFDRTRFGMDFYADQGVLGTDVKVTVAVEGMLPK